MDFSQRGFYHVYNRGNNGQKIFYDNENYTFFLRKIRNHLSPLVSIVAYCLLPNHFHFLIYVDYTYSLDDFESSNKLGLKSKKISNGIAIILRSYTQAINKRYARTGSLFQQKTKAKYLESRYTNYPFICFHYIHQNPLKAGLVKRVSDWEYSSYNCYVNVYSNTSIEKVIAYDLLDIPPNSNEFIKQSDSVQIFNEIYPSDGSKPSDG
ncbi:MAG: transposase [Bacteroidota bacterium]